MPLNYHTIILNSLAFAVYAVLGCESVDDGDEGVETNGDSGSATAASSTGGVPPPASPCTSYCFNVRTCANGWTADQRFYASQDECITDCESFLNRGGSCSSSARAYFDCAASFRDCDDYVSQHDAMCEAQGDSFEGWCAP